MLNETEELNGKLKKSFCFLHSGILIGHIRLIERRNEKRSLEVLSGFYEQFVMFIVLSLYNKNKSMQILIII